MIDCSTETHTQRKRKRGEISPRSYISSRHGSGSKFIRGEPKADIPMETKTIMYCTFPPKSAVGPIVDLEYIFLRTYVCIVLCRLHIDVFWEGIDVMLENYRMVYCIVYLAVRMYK